VKGEDASEEYRRLDAMSCDGEVACLDRPIEYRNRLDGIVRKAESQLRSTPAPPEAFRILWVSCQAGDAEFIRAEFEQTLYGLKDLAVFDKTLASCDMLPCFYYDRAAFFRYREIDAAVISGPQGGQLFLNEFGQSPDRFRESRLYTLLAGKRAVMDPQLRERGGVALAIRGDIDRSDDKAKWEYLLETYGYSTAPARSCHFVAVTSVPLRDEA